MSGRGSSQDRFGPLFNGLDRIAVFDRSRRVVGRGLRSASKFKMFLRTVRTVSIFCYRRCTGVSGIRSQSSKSSQQYY